MLLVDWLINWLIDWIYIQWCIFSCNILKHSNGKTKPEKYLSFCHATTTEVFSSPFSLEVWVSNRAKWWWYLSLNTTIQVFSSLLPPQFEPAVEPSSVRHIHHMLLFGCYSPLQDESLYSFSDICLKLPKDIQNCFSVMFSWAVGGEVGVNQGPIP